MTTQQGKNEGLLLEPLPRSHWGPGRLIIFLSFLLFLPIFQEHSSMKSTHPRRLDSLISQLFYEQVARCALSKWLFAILGRIIPTPTPARILPCPTTTFKLCVRQRHSKLVCIPAVATGVSTSPNSCLCHVTRIWMLPSPSGPGEYPGRDWHSHG